MTEESESQRAWWRTPALAFAAVMPVVILVRGIRGLPVYLTADAGHALADADALVGHGVRSIGHAPLLPAITVAVTALTSDLDALRLLAIGATLAMTAAFYFFIRGRTGSHFAEILATILFAFAPTTAEALGYFGVVMLLGIACAIAAMRAIDDWLIAPSPRRAAVAGTAIALTAFAHTVGLAWLVQVGFVIGLLEIGALIRMPREKSRRRIRTLARSLPIVLAFTAVAAVEASRFLGGIANPVRFAPSLDRLRLIEPFGFRGEGSFWMIPIVGTLVVLPLSARYNPRSRRVAMWSIVAVVVAVANLVAMEGAVQYEARYIYLLPLPAAVTVACLVAFLARRTNPQTILASGAALTLAATGVVALSARAFDERLHITLPYYNHVDRDELAMLEWIRAHPGVTLVAGRNANFFAGSDYAWTVEGIAKARAFAPAEGFTNLFADQRAESDDAATFLAGESAVFAHGLLAGLSARGDLVHVLRRVDNAWIPAADVVTREHAPTRLTVASTKRGLSVSASGATLLVDERSDSAERRGLSTRLRRDQRLVEFAASHAPVDAARSAVRVSTNRLLRKHRVRWVWVWDEPASGMLSDLLDRGLSIQRREGAAVLLRVP